jgi:D-tyrosyl-tRNA(Tyr) deacylase
MTHLCIFATMRLVIQRVGEASVSAAGKTLASIGRGLLILAAVAPEDSESDAAWVAGKVARLRVFSDPAGKMNLSLADIGGEVIVVSQFTLFAETAKGNRPSFSGVAAPEAAKRLYLFLIACLEKELGRPVGAGEFGADMRVALVNDGPVTLIMDTRNRE